MKNRGFTLAELLGVIAILSILALITIPVIDNSLKTSKEELYKTQEKQIIQGAKDYFAMNLSKLPENGKTVDVTLNDIQKEGYLPSEIKNPATDKNFSPTTTVRVTRVEDGYKYELLKNTIGD